MAKYLICGKGMNFRQGTTGSNKALVSPAVGHRPVKYTLGPALEAVVDILCCDCGWF